jgi:hypothetical protein
MNAPAIIPVRVRRDGRLYPVGWRRPEPEIDAVIDLVHRLRCQDGLSYRQVTAKLLESGYRVSLGAVHGYHRRYWCDLCKDETP